MFLMDIVGTACNIALPITFHFYNHLISPVVDALNASHGAVAILLMPMALQRYYAILRMNDSYTPATSKLSFNESKMKPTNYVTLPKSPK